MEGKEAEKVVLKPMEDAPKDGTRILVFWYDEKMDLRNYNVREARWWKPESVTQWENGARPHWEYVDDTDSYMRITDPLGWIEKPDLKHL